MATDIEESDTEDHERPAPPKRKCIKIINVTNESDEESDRQPDEQNGSQNDTDNEPLARETLLYQQYQLDKQCYMGSVDNTINRVMETYILTLPSERAQLRLFRQTEMEDRAVMMAIRNHGLVHSAEMAASSCVTNEYWSRDDEPMDVTNSQNNSNELPLESNVSASESGTSSDIFTTKTFQQFDEKLKHNWSTEKIDDGDQQQDILERAVAEAIKIKGLSALSVDYG